MVGQFDTGGFRLVSRSLKIGFLPLLGLLSWLGSLDADTIPEIVARAKPAVVQIITFDQNKEPIKTGTGFFVTQMAIFDK